MKVKFNTSISSLAGSYIAGQETDIDANLARSWAKSGVLTALEPFPAEPAVKASKPKGTHQPAKENAAGTEGGEGKPPAS